ncbi:MAG: gluconate 2-dehydrogenase subunit 3 family protein [Gemmatimonadota bacterium]
MTLEALEPTTSLRFYGDREMAVLSRVSDLLLPRTETPGALDARVPEILDQLMTEWASRETQASHRAALAELDAALETRAGSDFLGVPDVVAEEALAAVDAAVFAGGPPGGYRSLKGLIRQAYFSTEAGAVDEQGWVAVPNRWDPCVERS